MVLAPQGAPRGRPAERTALPDEPRGEGRGAQASPREHREGDGAGQEERRGAAAHLRHVPQRQPVVLRMRSVQGRRGAVRPLGRQPQLRERARRRGGEEVSRRAALHVGLPVHAARPEGRRARGGQRDRASLRHGLQPGLVHRGAGQPRVLRLRDGVEQGDEAPVRVGRASPACRSRASSTTATSSATTAPTTCRASSGNTSIPPGPTCGS